MSIQGSAFHGRYADAARAWTTKNGLMLPAHFGDASDEAIAGRFSAVLTDISWRWRLSVKGRAAGDCMSHVMTREVRGLAVGQSLKALWLNDKGALRGAGAVARTGADAFQLVSTTPDPAWFARAAAIFDVEVENASSATAGLAVIGPYAGHVLAQAGLDPRIPILSFERAGVGSVALNVSRIGEHGGYELWCAAEDAAFLWNRIEKAGAAFGLRIAGTMAMDILDIEAGIARPSRDYALSRNDFDNAPLPGEVGLSTLVDTGHLAFNGRSAYLDAVGCERTTVAGVRLELAEAAPFSALVFEGRRVGRTLSSVYSPMLRTALALASLELGFVTGTPLGVLMPAGVSPSVQERARVVDLPFVPSSVQIGL